MMNRFSINIIRVFSFFQFKNFGGLSIWMLSFITVGTVVYKNFENWSWVDSFYFSVMTLTTVGYGDLAPTSDFTKLFTSVYILAGLGVTIGFVSAFFEHRRKVINNEDDHYLNKSKK